MHLLYLEDNVNGARNDHGRLRLATFYNNIPPYAILSHRWGEDEPTFDDLKNDTGMSKEGYFKLLFCAHQAWEDDLKYCWVDTCCIDKTSSAELSEAINSMFQWYQKADRCYVYLSDVRAPDEFDRSAWFTRGWTLQELLAPRHVEFYYKSYSPILGVRSLGSRFSLKNRIHEITGIPIPALEGQPLSQFKVEQRMSWVERRETTREEDKAYCLLGLCDVFMPVIYGEGNKAFRRLKCEIRRLEDIGDDHPESNIASATTTPGLNTSTPPQGSSIMISLPEFVAERGLKKFRDAKLDRREPKHGSSQSTNSSINLTSVHAYRPKTSADFPNVTGKQRNARYNCFGWLGWEMVPSHASDSLIKISCTKCILKAQVRWRKDLQLPDGQFVPIKTIWQRFHLGIARSRSGRLQAPPSESQYYFRCFICKDGKQLQLSKMMEHIREKHTYNEVCG